MEALFASFLLLTAILMSVSLFDSTLQAESNNEQRLTAALIAESALDEVREATTRDFNATLTNYDGRTWTMTTYPGFQIETKVSQFDLPVPCSELESQYQPVAVYPAPARRYLSSSVLKVTCQVSWGNQSYEQISVESLVADTSPVTNFRIVLDPPGATVLDPDTRGTFPANKNQTLRFSATAFNGSDRIDDIVLKWSVEPVLGLGSVQYTSRDGKFCTYKNVYRNYNGQKRYSPGTCRLVVKGEFQGVEAVRKVMINND